MDHHDFYTEKKYCEECGTYRTYLQSIERSYCSHCGAEVRLFSKPDWEAFHESLQVRRPKGGRPRKGQGKESA